MCGMSSLTTCRTTLLLVLITHTANVCVAVAAAATTTSLLPLQPPYNVTSTTTTSIFQQQTGDDEQQQQQQQQTKPTPKHSMGDNVAVKIDDSWLSDGTKKQQPQQKRKYQVLGPRVPPNYQNQLTDFQTKSADPAKLDDSLRYVHGFVSQTVVGNSTTVVPTNSHGYIQFEMHTPPTQQTQTSQPADSKMTTKKQETVNEVLSNLFPNGFSDIFRFSYAAEPAPAPTTVQPATTTPIRPTNRTLVSFATSVTREYRREVSPGHTQIVVEKIHRTSAQPTSSEEFRDGNNQISKDELMRINRAAVDASVLPSLLLKPATQANGTNATTPTALTLEPEPIVILNDSALESDEMDEADNQIAESQNIGTHIYQSLPYQPSAEHPPEINVHIVHDDTLANVQSESYQSRQQQHLPGVVDFQAQNYVQEAPSRKFLKTFKPKLSKSADRPIPKGNFHYEGVQGRHLGNYGTYYAQPAATQEQQPAQLSSKLPNSKLNVPLSPDYHGYDVADQTTEVPHSVVFVTLGTPAHHSPDSDANSEIVNYSSPIPTATPHSYVSEAAGKAPQLKQHSASSPAYTFVEVQKSVNIHNKLITERDGRLVEQHETIYPQQQQKRDQPTQQQQQQQKQYQSLTKNPINVASVDGEGEHYAEAASHTVEQHVEPTAESHVHIAHDEQQHPDVQQHYENHAEQQDHQEAVQQHYVEHTQHVEHQEQPVVHQQYAEHGTEHHVEEHAEPVHYAAPAAHDLAHEHIEQQIVHVEQPHESVAAHEAHHAVHVDNHVEIEAQQLSEHHSQGVQLLPTAPAQTYYAQEILERHIPVPYAVPEPVPVPVHVEHYIDRPYPVETIIEKRIPYPVEKVVEKVVEKQVPVEVERIVEKPVEKVVEKYVDRPVAVPIHVPVAIHIPTHAVQDYGHGGFGHSGFGHNDYGHSGYGQPESIPWAQSGHSVGVIPQKVLRNYYTRMLKKLMPQMAVLKLTPTKAPQTATKTQGKKLNQPSANANKQNQKSAYNFIDTRHTDLIPPPPPSSSSWSQGARYIYNTLPRDLTGAAASAYSTAYERYKAPVRSTATPLSAGAASAAEPYDEFQRWRNGHSIKRSPDFGRNLHMEYGFKPPLVPSLEIDERGMPLQTNNDNPKA